MGRPKSQNPKVAVSLRLDADVLAWWRESGEGWQSRMNDWLRKAMPGGEAETVQPTPIRPRSPTTVVVQPKRTVVVNARGVQIGPVMAAPGSRLKKR